MKKARTVSQIYDNKIQQGNVVKIKLFIHLFIT